MSESFSKFFVWQDIQRTAGQWWHTPLISALRRQRQVSVSLKLAWSTSASSGQAPKLQRNPVSKNQKYSKNTFKQKLKPNNKQLKTL